MTENTRESIEEVQQEYPAGERPLAEMGQDRVLAGLDNDGLLELGLRAERAESEARAVRLKSYSALSQRPDYARRAVLCAQTVPSRTAPTR